MSSEQRKPAPEDLLQTKERLLEQWRLLPPEHQATMLLVLLKGIDDIDMRDWTRSAIATAYPLKEQRQQFFPDPVVTRSQLARLDLDEQELAKLTDADLATIAERIQAAYVHDEFWDELMLQVLEFHTEQVLQEKRTHR